MLTGESFVGKTTFLAAIVNSIVEQYKFKSPNILFVNVFELMETIKNKTLYFDSLDSCKKCDILVFDDRNISRKATTTGRLTVLIRN